MNNTNNTIADKLPGKTGSGKSLLNISFTALFAALIAGGTFIAIPIGPVPIVMQNLFVLLAGLILGPGRGVAAVGLYMLAGILGAPVFAGFTGGITRFAGPTGGFLAGYFLAAFTAGIIARETGSSKDKVSTPRMILAVASGLLVVYPPGVVWLKIVTGLSWDRALITGFLLFIPGDILKGIAAVLIAGKMRKTALDHLNE